MTPITFKLCSCFNTAEFTVDKMPELEDLQEIYDLLAGIKVKDIDIPQRAAKKVTEAKVDKPVSLATEKQKLLMRQKHIEYNEGITAKEAFLKLNAASNVYPDKTIK